MMSNYQITKLPNYQIIVLIFCICFSHQFFSQCHNGDAEYNNFNNWGASSGPRNNFGYNLNDQVNGVNPLHHNITNVGYDLTVGGTILPTVNDGLHSFKIGNDNVGDKTADRIWYTFTVSPTNANFGFRFAMVLADGEHTPKSINPSFSWSIIEGNDPNNLTTPLGFSNVIVSSKYIADKNDPFFKLANNSNIVYKDWQSVCYDLSEYIGKTVTVSFDVLDCNQGGHFGYANIDGLCESHVPIVDFNVDTKYCIDQPVIIDGTATKNEDSYFLAVQELDAYLNPIGIEYSQWLLPNKLV